MYVLERTGPRVLGRALGWPGGVFQGTPPRTRAEKTVVLLAVAAGGVTAISAVVTTITGAIYVWPQMAHQTFLCFEKQHIHVLNT